MKAFIPFSVEPDRLLSKPVIELLGRLGGQGEGGSFVSNVDCGIGSLGT
jgi:hypothetical protein